MRLPTVRILAAPALLAVLLLSGCGGSDKAATPGDSSSSSSDSSKPANGKVMKACDAITAEEVGAILGATVTSSVGPSGQCEYEQDDPRAMSAAVDAAVDVEGAGGIEGAKSGTTGALSGDAEDVSGVGDAAFVVVGKFAGGSNDQAQGVVAIKGQLVTVNITQASGLPAAQVHDAAVALLKLAASKA